MPSSEKATSGDNPSGSEKDMEDDWQIVTEEDGQRSGDFEKLETPGNGGEKDAEDSRAEKSTTERKRDAAEAKWAGMQPQRGGVYPDGEVKAPSYPSFTGNW